MRADEFFQFSMRVFAGFSFITVTEIETIKVILFPVNVEKPMFKHFFQFPCARSERGIEQAFAVRFVLNLAFQVSKFNLCVDVLFFREVTRINFPDFTFFLVRKEINVDSCSC